MTLIEIWNVILHTPITPDLAVDVFKVVGLTVTLLVALRCAYLAVCGIVAVESAILAVLATSVICLTAYRVLKAMLPLSAPVFITAGVLSLIGMAAIIKILLTPFAQSPAFPPLSRSISE